MEYRRLLSTILAQSRLSNVRWWASNTMVTSLSHTTDPVAILKITEKSIHTEKNNNPMPHD